MSLIQLDINNRYKQLACPTEATLRLFRALETSDSFSITGGELSVAFVDDTTIAKIHREFMEDPSPTDVITFPASPEMNFAGEIIVSVDHARNRAKDFGVLFSHELSLYLAHGWLHLAGYDDRTEKDRIAMRNAEREALAIVDQASASDGFRLL